LPKPFDYQILVDIIENKCVHEELKKINATLNRQERIQVEQLWDTLKGLKKLK
jgi:hypothetical protein